MLNTFFSLFSQISVITLFNRTVCDPARKWGIGGWAVVTLHTLCIGLHPVLLFPGQFIVCSLMWNISEWLNKGKLIILPIVNCPSSDSYIVYIYHFSVVCESLFMFSCCQSPGLYTFVLSCSIVWTRFFLSLEYMYIWSIHRNDKSSFTKFLTMCWTYTKSENMCVCVWFVKIVYLYWI